MLNQVTKRDEIPSRDEAAREAVALAKEVDASIRNHGAEYLSGFTGTAVEIESARRARLAELKDAQDLPFR